MTLFKLPFLASRTPTESNLVHIINPLVNASGGSEHRTIELAKLISKQAEVRVWSDRKFSTELGKLVKINQITPPWNYPKGGNLVFIGAYFRIGKWAKFVNPRRVTVLYNTPDEADLDRFLREMVAHGLREQLEFVYAADWMRKRTGIAGPVHVSPIDLGRFSPRPWKTDGKQFTVGRLSRDVLEKHHPEDPKLWIALEKMGFRVRLMGATCLTERLPAGHNLEILPTGAESPEDFLNSLDAFVYRTDADRFFEPSGRVVSEAMCCGIPVVCGVEGGHVESIQDGHTGFLFDSNDRAISIISELRGDRVWHSEISRRARESMVSIHSDEAMLNLAKYYLSPTRPAHEL